MDSNSEVKYHPIIYIYFISWYLLRIFPSLLSACDEHLVTRLSHSWQALTSQIDLSSASERSKHVVNRRVDLYIEISAQECQQVIKVQKQQFLISTWRIWHWSKSYTCSHTCDEISDFLRRSFEISYNLLEDSPGSSRLGIPRNNVTVRGLQECPGSYSWPERSSAHPESLSSTDSVPWTCKTWPMLKCSTFKIVSTFSFWGSPACAGQMDLFASPGFGQNVSIKKISLLFFGQRYFSLLFFGEIKFSLLDLQTQP